MKSRENMVLPITVEPPKALFSVYSVVIFKYYSGQAKFYIKTLWNGKVNMTDAIVNYLKIHIKELEAKKEKKALEQKESDRRIDFRKKWTVFSIHLTRDRFKTRNLIILCR